MTTSVKLGTQAIGAAGELLVQYELLKLGIDSARLTTDSGIDLAMYVPGHQSAATVQVKTKLRPVPAGGKGKLLLSWPFPDDSKAQWLACVDLSTDSVWMFPLDMARELAQQKHAGGTRLLYFYTTSHRPKALRQSDMTGHRLEPVIATPLDGQPRESREDRKPPPGSGKRTPSIASSRRQRRQCKDLNEPGERRQRRAIERLSDVPHKRLKTQLSRLFAFTGPHWGHSTGQRLGKHRFGCLAGPVFGLRPTVRIGVHGDLRRLMAHGPLNSHRITPGSDQTRSEKMP